MDDFFHILSPRYKARMSLGRLNQAIFACLLDPLYPDNLYLFEHRIHKYKREFMRASLRYSELNHFFDAMMNYAQLRWRVTDYSVLSVCENELKNLSQAIDVYIMLEDESPLKAALQKFESIYQSVLQVPSPDALAFLLFIDGVRASCK